MLSSCVGGSSPGVTFVPGAPPPVDHIRGRGGVQETWGQGSITALMDAPQGDVNVKTEDRCLS
jgi:hypothetical protein